MCGRGEELLTLHYIEFSAFTRNACTAAVRALAGRISQCRKIELKRPQAR